MREMKPSGLPWVENIPEGWKIARGKEILTLLTRPVEPTDGVITCFRDGEVTLRSKRRELGFTFSTQETGYQGIEPGDLVIHGMDGFAGSIGISDSRGKATPVLNVMDSNQNKKYLMYYFRAIAKAGYFESVATGIRVRTCDTNWNKISVTPCLVPPIEEQFRIASFLDSRIAKIDDAIARYKALSDKLDEYRKAIITKSVTEGVRGTRTMKDSNVDIIGDIPASWNMIRLKFLCSITTGNKDTKDADNNGKYPLYVRSPKVENCNDYSFEGESILMAGDGAGAGRIFHHAFGKYAVHQRVYILFKITNIDSSYLFYYLSNKFCDEMDRGSAQSTVPSVRLPMLKDFQIPIPPQIEQKEIVAYLDKKCSEIDSSKEKIEAVVKKLEDYKKSLIFNAVTGKIEC